MDRKILFISAIVVAVFLCGLCVFIPSPPIHVGMKLGDPVAYIQSQGGGQERRFTRTHWATSGDTLDWDVAFFVRPWRIIATLYVTCKLATDGTVVSVESSWHWSWRF